MRKATILLPLTLIGVILSISACNTQERVDLSGKEAILELSSSMGPRVTTQDDQTNHWDGNERIGVFSSSLTAFNVLYTATGSGVATTFKSGTPITIPYSGKQHDVKAYYPYDATATTVVNIDLTQRNDQPLLYATAWVTNANPKANLEFKNKLGKLRIKVVTSNLPHPSEPITNVSVNGVMTRASLDIKSDEFTVARSVRGNLNLNRQGEEYYTYLMPGESIKGKEIDIEQGGNIYRASLTSDVTVASGNYYYYTVSISNGSTEIFDGAGTIDGEHEGDSGEVIGAPGEGTTLTCSSNAYAYGVLSAATKGGSYSFTLSGLEVGTRVTTKADPAVNWLSISGDVTLRTTSSQSFTIEVKANESSKARKTTITLSAKGMSDLSFVVNQAAKQVTPQPNPPVVGEGDGTVASPYTVAQAISKQGEKGVYVKGYIIGGVSTGPKLTDGSQTNLMLADSMDETNIDKMIPVELPKGAIRDALNLIDNPNNWGKLVAIQGNLETYFKVSGLKNARDYIFL